MPAYDDDLRLAHVLADSADSLTMARFKALDLVVDTKPDLTPVSDADRTVEQAIRSTLQRARSRDAVTGEEFGETGHGPRRWLLDPIDGTKTFVAGVPLYGVLVGVEVRGEPAVGVVYLPALDEMVAAADGLGCAWNGRPCHVSSTDRLEDALLVTSSVSACQARSGAYERLAAATRLERTWGDCYGYVLVATGRAEVMLDPVINPWDCAPMPPIFREAGGRFTTWAGEETIWGPDGFATNGALNEQVLAVLRAERRNPDADMRVD